MTGALGSGHLSLGLPLGMWDPAEGDRVKYTVDLCICACLFSPRKEEWKLYGIEKLIFPDFNFKVLEVHKDGVVLETSFQYSSYTSQFKISFAEPMHRESFCSGRYSYSFTLTFEKR